MLRWYSFARDRPQCAVAAAVIREDRLVPQRAGYSYKLPRRVVGKRAGGTIRIGPAEAVAESHSFAVCLVCRGFPLTVLQIFFSRPDTRSTLSIFGKQFPPHPGHDVPCEVAKYGASLGWSAR